VDAPQRFVPARPVDGFQTEGVLAERERPLVTEAAATETLEAGRLGALGTGAVAAAHGACPPP